MKLLKLIWLRLINPKFAQVIETRCQLLEVRMKAVEQAQLAILQRFPEPPGLKSGEDKPKVKLSRPWTQRRTWLEATDGGRVHVKD
jgi:hypothetical protein